MVQAGTGKSHTCLTASITVARSDLLGFLKTQSHGLKRKKGKRRRKLRPDSSMLTWQRVSLTLFSPINLPDTSVHLGTCWRNWPGRCGPWKDMTQNGTVAGNGTHTDSLKIVIVGDGGCGKTSLLLVYSKGDFPEVSFYMMIKLQMTILCWQSTNSCSWLDPFQLFLCV